MKVLWFTNSPCGSVRRFSESVKTGGWMISLEDKIKKVPDINLFVAYISSKKEQPFKYDGVMYYPIDPNIPQNKIGRVLYRFASLKSHEAILLPQLLRIVNIVKPDLIHIHGTEECFGLILNYINHIPIAISIQGLLAPYKEKFFAGISEFKIKKYESLFDKIKGISYIRDYKILTQKAKREINYLNNTKYIFGRTSWDRDITKLFNSKGKYFIVNEILRTPFYQVQWNKNKFSEKIKLVSIISIGIYKGYETLLKAANLISKYANFQFEWNIIGYQLNDRCARLTHKITKLNPTDNNVKFLGRLDAKGIAKVLLDSDIYCHVSHIENSPNSVCEAMILGMPIIASNVGGTQSLLENKLEGLLYQDGDPYVLAANIVYLVSHFNEAKQMGYNARKRALYRHDASRVVRELTSAYNNILLNK